MDEEPKAVEPAEEPKAEPARLPVRVVGRKGASALVEWVEDIGGVPAYHRAYVPASAVRDGAVAPRTLKRGIPYGQPWEEYIEISATPEAAANELRRRGVWRWEDMNMAALNAANRAFDTGAFLRRAKREVSKHGK